jgi:hypothetical protein
MGALGLRPWHPLEYGHRILCGNRFETSPFLVYSILLYLGSNGVTKDDGRDEYASIRRILLRGEKTSRWYTAWLNRDGPYAQDIIPEPPRLTGRHHGQTIYIERYSGQCLVHCHDSRKVRRVTLAPLLPGMKDTGKIFAAFYLGILDY